MMSSPNGDLKGNCLFGAAVVAIFLGGGALWATTAPIGGAVIANGLIGFEGKRKTVQHLEGGIIKEILVTEGDVVKAGQAIMVMDDTAARARADELRNRIRTYAAEEARLQAERAGNHKISFDHPLLENAKDHEIAAILDQQRSLFAARANNLRTQRNILWKRMSQLKKQIEGLTIQLEGVREQKRLIREEASDVQKLVDQGYERKPRLLAILRAKAQVTSTEGELIANIARSEEAIGETRTRMANLETDLLEKVDARLTQVKAERMGDEKLYREIMDRLSRTRVLSPTDGVVLDVRFKTVGGVVRPGESILDIAPEHDELIINAQIRPTDIDEVTTGAPATVSFTAFHRRYIKRVKGEVTRVSPDAFEDQKSGHRYYTADVKIDRKHLKEVAPELDLTAGMPAEVFIATGDRTAADYLMQPIRRSLERAFRES